MSNLGSYLYFLVNAWDRIFASGLAVLLSAVAAIAQSHPAAVIDFDIGAQSLATALDAYSVATGLVAVYDGELAVGRQSNGLRGSYAPEAALQLLLSNSGLVAQFTTTGAFVLLPGQSPATDVNTPSMIGLAALARQNAVEQQYSGLVQSSINQALCGVPETRPGNYRVAMSFRIGLSGEITNLKLLGSTGDRGRDEAIVDTLQRLRSIGEPDHWQRRRHPRRRFRPDRGGARA